MKVLILVKLAIVAVAAMVLTVQAWSQEAHTRRIASWRWSKTGK